MGDIDSLAKLFKDSELLKLALTHRSWVNENPGQRSSNERLEFLGDAILEFIVSEELFKRFPEKEEGYLTALRANLVNTQNLSSIAQKLKVGNSIFLSKGEEDGGGRANPSLLADCVEAIIGALFLDRGIKIVAKFLAKNLFVEIPEKIATDLKDAKSKLQELIQAKGKIAPKYIVAQESGPDHAKHFIIDVVIDGKSYGRGEGKSKSEAEQEAAANALTNLL